MIEFEVYGLGAIGNVPSWMYGVILAVLVIGSGDIVLTQKTRKAQKIATLLLVEYVVLVFCSVVVFREERAASAINLLPLSSYFFIAENSYLWEVAAINLLNIAMFIPIGMLIKICNLNHDLNNWKGAMVLGLLLSMTIEVSQFVFRKGLCEVDDVIHNALGCMIGYGVARVALKMLRKLKE